MSIVNLCVLLQGHIIVARSQPNDPRRTLRPPPNVEFVTGYPGIPGHGDIPSAFIEGVGSLCSPKLPDGIGRLSNFVSWIRP
jgi:hypothetical protein